MITKEQAVRELREIAEARAIENGGHDWIYSNPDSDGQPGDCLYVHGTAGNNATAGCIIGCWFERHGVPLEFLAEYEFCYPPRVIEEFNSEASIRLDVDDDAQEFLSEVQRQQDDGRSGWLAAIDRALEVVAL